MNMMNIAWYKLKKEYQPMAHFEAARPLQNDRNPNDPSSGKFDPSMTAQKRPLDPQSKSAQAKRALARYANRTMQPPREVPVVSGDSGPSLRVGQQQPQQIQRGYPFIESWGTLLKESMCKGDDCKGCRGCKTCPKCKPEGSTCEKRGCGA
jgi:hypothetical protein